MTLLNKALFSYAIFLLSTLSQAEELPKIEVGLAAGAQYLADYRGSKEYHANALPFPIVHYRGDRIKIDRRGIRGDLLREKSWEINVSAEVSLNGGSDDNKAREGMPELDSAFEFGPSFNLALDGNIEDDGFMLRFPLRSVVTASTEGFEYIGYVFNPKITYLIENGPYEWRSSTSVGALWASEEFHDYYYQVDDVFALADRRAYDAKKGFSGLYLKTSLTKRTGDWRYGVALRYDNLSEARFRDSPLIDTNHYFSVSFLLARYFWKSDF